MIAWLPPPVAALLLCNYRLASIALGGLETALVGFSTIVTISFIARSDGAFTLGRAAGLGALLGAASLSRMDALLFGGIVLAWLGCRALPAGPARTGAIVGVAGAAMLATLIPWFVFSETHVHAWLPRSGEETAAAAVARPHE